MGDPKKSKKAYARPNRPWDKDRIEQEKELMKKYGLRRKKEIWKAETILSDYRRRARELIANHDDTKAGILLNKLFSIGLLEKNATLDDVLDLKAEQFLERRLQTIAVKKELANTPTQARQFIVHGHISVNNQKITTPSYVVKIDEEKDIAFAQNSGLTKTFILKKDKTQEIPKEVPKKEVSKEVKEEVQKDAVEELKEVVEKTTTVEKAIDAVD
ncbi:MAG: 30S ribosomal protein S4 [Candidatus Aenigmarchaeota archaeon]|nr:30S ribosomal protein S4 [Candidatus Aenigmarchaeota archaeon]